MASSAVTPKEKQTKYRPETNQEANWALARMRRVLRIWEGLLTVIDKEFVLRRIRDREPQLFYRIAREVPDVQP